MSRSFPKGVEDFVYSISKLRSCQSIICSFNQHWFLERGSAKVPNGTTMAKLQKFAHLDFRHSAPDAFKTYCQSVMDSQILAEGNTRCIGGVRVTAVSGNFSSLSAQDIKDVDSVFSGASLIIAVCSKVCLIVHV